MPDKKKVEQARTKAESIYEKLRKGADFGYLAFKYSDDRQSAMMGGEIGYVQKGMLPPDVEKKIFSLKRGEFTEPIESDYGYYIFKILDNTKRVIALCNKVEHQIVVRYMSNIQGHGEVVRQDGKELG